MTNPLHRCRPSETEARKSGSCDLEVSVPKVVRWKSSPRPVSRPMGITRDVCPDVLRDFAVFSVMRLLAFPVELLAVAELTARTLCSREHCLRMAKPIWGYPGSVGQSRGSYLRDRELSVPGSSRAIYVRTLSCRGNCLRMAKPICGCPGSDGQSRRSCLRDRELSVPSELVWVTTSCLSPAICPSQSHPDVRNIRSPALPSAGIIEQMRVDARSRNHSWSGFHVAPSLHDRPKLPRLPAISSQTSRYSYYGFWTAGLEFAPNPGHGSAGGQTGSFTSQTWRSSGGSRLLYREPERRRG
jgi:hypothetical protein